MKLEEKAMQTYGKLNKVDERYKLKFERAYAYSVEEVWGIVTNPKHFTQWYPFATGEMELRLGGKIYFDDGEGSTYEGVITELAPPHIFAFREIDDLLSIELKTEDDGCCLVFEHTFDDASMSTSVATGWHRCLDALGMIIEGSPVEWPDNAASLRKTYKETFNS